MIEWFISLLSIVGAILNMKKIKEGFLLWIIANLCWIGVDIYYEMWGQIPIWIAFTVISLLGYRAWSDD